MKHALSVPQQRLAALALLAGALALAWFGAIAPVIAVVQSRAEARQAALRALSRDRGLIAQAPSVSAALTSVEHSAQWTRLYESQKSDRATLQLETDLRSVFSAPGSLSAMTAEPAVVQGPLTRLGVRVTLAMPMDEWAEALGNLQQHARLLRLESVTIQAPDFQPADTNPKLSIQAEIVGYMLTPQKARTRS